MSLFYTSDPLKDFYHHDREQNRLLDRLPKCDCCRMPIQDEYMFDVYGDAYCEKCATQLFRREVALE